MQRTNSKNKLHIIPKSPGLIITLLLFLVVGSILMVGSKKYLEAMSI